MTDLDHNLIYPSAAAICGAFAAISDARTRRIPNALTLSGVAFGLGIHGVLDGWNGLLTSMAAMLIAGLIFFAFYVAGGMGAGDVKLIAAVAALAGLPNTPSLLIATSLVGGAMAVVLAIRRGALLTTFGNVFSIAKHHSTSGFTPHPELNVRNTRTLRLPYGLAIAGGCIITLYLAAVRS